MLQVVAPVGRFVVLERLRPADASWLEGRDWRLRVVWLVVGLVCGIEAEVALRLPSDVAALVLARGQGQRRLHGLIVVVFAVYGLQRHLPSVHMLQLPYLKFFVAELALAGWAFRLHNKINSQCIASLLQQE